MCSIVYFLVSTGMFLVLHNSSTKAFLANILSSDVLHVHNKGSLASRSMSKLMVVIWLFGSSLAFR